MSALRGSLSDGRNAASTPVSITRDGDDLLISAETTEFRVPLRDVAADARVLGVARTLTLPDGKQITTSDQDTIAEWFPARHWVDHWAYDLESRWAAAFASIVVIVAVLWLFIQVALPLAAKPVASMISPKIAQLIGVQALDSLDHSIFKPSKLSEERQEDIENRFYNFLAREPGAEGLSLKFRGGALGPNALALPGGIIVVTDDMVKLASDDELLAVLAHEIGHVRGQHSIRTILQSSGVVVLMTAVAGDAMTMTVLAAAVPTALLESHYSREFELEADDYAFAHLKRHGYSPQLFADVMRRMEKAEKDGGTAGVFQYFSSHPATDERILRAEAQR